MVNIFDPQAGEPDLAWRINFVGTNDTSDPLRGSRLFKGQMATMARVSQTWRMETGRCGLYIVLMPRLPAFATRLEKISTFPCQCRTIVDVHADFWDSTATVLGAADWWREGDHIAVLEQCIRAADLVTVPSPAYVDSLLKLTSHVAVVPDCPRGEPTTRAAVAWAQAIALAQGRSHPHRDTPNDLGFVDFHA